MKVIIVGGVAGGASCAARLRRLDESAEIVLLERGPYMSYANCGLPYHIGDVIEKESALLVASAELFRAQFDVDARVLTHWFANPDALILDVRAKPELAVEGVAGAVHIPLGELRARLDELPRDREIHVLCRSAQRAYYATRVLVQNGFDARVISGGMLSHAMLAAR
ncbi:MAG: rhodanese-like domain-containing protein [Candidatus Nanopelagicales bacterium]